MVRLATGETVSWMNVADEATGAHLKAQVYEQAYMGEINELIALRDINRLFARWGLPESIKIDNGWPFVNPSKKELPTLSKLWWVGLGIEVIQNPPRQPQHNGTVENLQGTLASWANPKGQSSIAALQQRLDEESEFQRNHYPVTAKGNKTRIELYPELLTNERKYDPKDFDINRVYEYLSDFVWSRQVNQGGYTNINGNRYYIGKAYKGQPIDVYFDPQNKTWCFAKLSGEILRTYQNGVPLLEDFKCLQ